MAYNHGTSGVTTVQVTPTDSNQPMYPAPPPYIPGANGQNGYPAPGYPAPYGTNNPNAVVVSQPIPIKQSFKCHYFWSCIAFWFCGILFGGIGFILAKIGNSRASENKPVDARKFGYASVAFIIIGLVAGGVVWGYIIYLLITSESEDDDNNIDIDICYNYLVYGRCYTYRNCAYTSYQCSYYYLSYVFYNGCCYYNY